jgi:superfamily II DNA/RNA helicase
MKWKIMNKFQDGRVDILCATEVAGMVSNPLNF